MLYSCATETRAPDDYTEAVTRTSAKGTYVATVTTSNPSPPAKGSDSWTVQIDDAGGAAIDGLTIGVVPFMPDHGHGTTVRALVTADGGGVYVMAPLYLYMEGYWEVTLNLQPPGGTPDTVMFPVCIP
jgi:hypothetical protein